MAAALAAATATSCAQPRSTPAPAPLPSLRREVPEAEPSDVVERVVAAHNARRAKAGLSPLALDPGLEAAAAEHARDMADRRKMSHKGGDGSSPFERMKQQGYRYQAAAENVAYGFDDVDAVMAGWLRSPGHRRNILGHFTEIGDGRAIDKDGVSYWCVTFGTPLAR